jgi:hypothetical protein
MKILSDASVWFVIGILCLLASFVMANYGVSNLFPAIMIGLSIAAFLVAIVINASNARVKKG